MKNMTESEYRQLVEEYSDMVTRLCVVHTGNFSDAEDCYQNVFFKLFKQMKKGSLPNPKAWLIRVALNECRSVLRYRLRKNTVDLNSITSFAKDGSDIEILDLIFRLPPKYRDSIYLYYFEELSVQEIAELRYNNPDFNLKDLGAAIDPPISRSGANHRLQKIAEIADRIRVEKGLALKEE